MDDFVAYGGYGEPLKDLEIKRAEGEELILHAEIYRAAYLGKIQPAINLQELMNSGESKSDSVEPPKQRMQIGTYFVPSTKKAE